MPHSLNNLESTTWEHTTPHIVISYPAVRSSVHIAVLRKSLGNRLKYKEIALGWAEEKSLFLVRHVANYNDYPGNSGSGGPSQLWPEYHGSGATRMLTLIVLSMDHRVPSTFTGWNNNLSKSFITVSRRHLKVRLVWITGITQRRKLFIDEETHALGCGSQRHILRTSWSGWYTHNKNYAFIM